MLDYNEPDSVLKFPTQDVSFCLIHYVPVDIVVVLVVDLELVLKGVFEFVLEELIEVAVIIEL